MLFHTFFLLQLYFQFIGAFKCRSCYSLNLSNGTAEAKTQLNALNFTLPPEKSNCADKPREAKLEDCAYKCVSGWLSLDLEQVPSSVNSDLRSIGKVDIALRGCLETILSPSVPNSVFTSEPVASVRLGSEAACVDVDASGWGGSGAAQLCACDTEDCNVGLFELKTPPTPDPPTRNASESFHSYNCSWLDYDKQKLGGAFRVLLDKQLEAQSQQSNTPWTRDCVGTPKIPPETCSSLAWVFGLTYDLSTYTGPDIRFSETNEGSIPKVFLTSLGKMGLISRGCMDGMVPDLPEHLLEDEGCVRFKSNIFGVETKGEGCMCNKEKCNGKGGMLGLNASVSHRLHSTLLTLLLLSWMLK